ncbi:hypothetical protein M409DRAFT_31179 [Zasmidium cellare ATCC 36951]|uniref:GA4 desaturase family protein n=1 Tax=Zasmidium cellare ATCC 36951 TaxID=1080233 RepID=A0A6A6BXN7_ZASCE|nr:uncharacterized protein M409DRAFT_31179 [Zasmidium cellare ATCC 36951]KAF2158299.1 hypothetical protein M409DRAFT_31179 [Zasmidium cellare ATCC 36951]
MSTISTQIKYLSQTATTDKDVVNPKLSFHERKLAYRSRPEADYERPRVKVSSMRGKEDDFSLQDQGFQVSTLHTKCTNFHDPETVKQTFYPEVVALLKKVAGAKFVRPYDHTLRYQTEADSLAAPPDNTTADIHGPARIVHVDDTPKNAHRMKEEDLSEVELAQWGGVPFAIMNVWKPLKPVRRDPLALIDARTICNDDRLAQPLPAPDTFGGDWEVFLLRWNTSHKWWYLQAQETHEALVFKMYDSREEDGFMGAAHVSVEEPGTEHIREARESIEVRSLVFF